MLTLSFVIENKDFELCQTTQNMNLLAKHSADLSHEYDIDLELCCKTVSDPDLCSSLIVTL